MVASGYDRLVVAALFGDVPPDFLVPCVPDGGHHFVAPQSPELCLEVLEFVAAASLHDQELMDAVAAAVNVPVPNLEDDAATIRPILDVLVIEAGPVHDQRIIIPDT